MNHPSVESFMIAGLDISAIATVKLHVSFYFFLKLTFMQQSELDFYSGGNVESKG